MTGSSSGMHELSSSLWPPADKAAWDRACSPLPGVFGGVRRLSPFSYETIRKGWAAYLWYLGTQELLP